MPDLDTILEAAVEQAQQPASPAGEGTPQLVEAPAPPPANEYIRSEGGFRPQAVADQPAATGGGSGSLATEERVVQAAAHQPPPEPEPPVPSGATREQYESAQRQLDELRVLAASREAELAQERAWRMQNEPVLRDVQEAWPDIQEAYRSRAKLERERASQAKKIDALMTQVNKAKEFGLEFDPEAFDRQAKLDAALDRMANLETYIEQAFDTREQRFRSQQLQAERSRQLQELDLTYERQFAELAKHVPDVADENNLPGLKLGLKAMWAQDPSRSVKDVAAPIVTRFAAAKVAADQSRRDKANSMPPTQRGSGAPPNIQAQSASNPYQGLGVKEILRRERAKYGMS